MRKRMTAIWLCVFMCLFQFTSVHAKGEQLPADNQYHVVNVKKDGTYEIIKSVTSYEEAKAAHTLLQKKYSNLGITYGDSFVVVEYGVISFDGGADCSINTKYTVAPTEAEGYLNGCYAGDAAFLEYNPEVNKIKFKISGVTAWVDAAIVTVYPLESIPSVSSFTVKDDILRHSIKSSPTDKGFANALSLSKAPAYLKEKETYYSYDSHYFYKTFQNMITDYREGSYQRAINKKEPYYNYYQYLDHRSTSSYTPSDITSYFKEELALNNTMHTFYDKDNQIHDILTQSLLFQGSEAFFQYQNQFGANALMMLSLSLNESALGRSYLAFSKNNLFGHAAYDSAAEESAERYSSINASIYSHALHYLSNAYLNPKEFQFYGGFFGNKAGGMNVQYASDPYWGEKAAQYYYKMDQAMGGKDENQYAYGISSGKQMRIYKKASEQSDQLYTIKEGNDGSFILLEKLKNKEGTWYRVQSDASLNKKRDFQEDGSYNFKHSYGYVKASDLNSIQNGKRIKNKNYVDITFDANGGVFYPDTAIITLQVENGQLPVMTAPTKDHALFIDWDIKLEKAVNTLTYKALYKDVKEIRLSEMPQTAYGLHDTLDVKNGKIIVEFIDGTSQETELTTDMVSGFQSDTTGKQTLTITYGGTAVNYEITMNSSIEEKQNELAERAGYIIKAYSGKVGLQEEAIEEITRFKEDLLALKKNCLTSDQIRGVDRIVQENLSHKYSIVIEDNHYDLQVSGMSLALPKEKGLLDQLLPKTVGIQVKNKISEEDEKIAKRVAKANNMQIEDILTLAGTDDFASLKLQQDVVFSLKKPGEKTNNKVYRIYFIDDEDVYQIPSTQSENRIVFTNDKLGSYVIVSQTASTLTDSQDFTEVNTIKDNGKNYIIRYIMLPIAAIFFLLIAFLAFLIYRRKHPSVKKLNNKKNKKKKS